MDNQIRLKYKFYRMKVCIACMSRTMKTLLFNTKYNSTGSRHIIYTCTTNHTTCTHLQQFLWGISCMCKYWSYYRTTIDCGQLMCIIHYLSSSTFPCRHATTISVQNHDLAILQSKAKAQMARGQCLWLIKSPTCFRLRVISMWDVLTLFLNIVTLLAVIQYVYILFS